MDEALVPGWVETKDKPRHGMACQSPIGKRPSEYCTKTRPIRALKKADIRCRTTTAAEQPRTGRQSTGAFDARTTTASGNLRVCLTPASRLPPTQGRIRRIEQTRREPRQRVSAEYCRDRDACCAQLPSLESLMTNTRRTCEGRRPTPAAAAI